MELTTFNKDDNSATLNPNMKVYANPFPKKMAKAIEFIEKNGLPPEVERVKKNRLHRKKNKKTPLQKELLTVFDINPTDAQMQELKSFLYQLFGQQIAQKNAQLETELAA